MLVVSLLSVNCTSTKKIVILVEDQQAIQVLEFANDLLQHPTSWNQIDDRSCADDQASKTYSLYCALYEGQMKYIGEYKHRGIVMKAVRNGIREISSQKYKHIIRDYNNLPSTTHKDILLVLERAKVSLTTN